VGDGDGEGPRPAMTTPLAHRIARLIEADGPMGLASYMALCLGDPRDGYYERREAIGRTGDFITAPQVSQMFGEMIGVWCLAAWSALGRPKRLVLAEAGPGNGTLMADLLRATKRFPEFAAALDIRLIETSEAMIARQREALPGVAARWHMRLDELPEGPLLLVANEFLDALPVRQFVKSGRHWRERCVGLDADGRLQWVLGAATIDAGLLPPGHEAEGDGAVYEVSPAREAWVQSLSERLARDSGMALLVDYGHAQSGFGDTFQAVAGHAFADALAEPGMADLTSHVDFSALARAAQGIDAPAIATQGDFLLATGLAERAGALGARADEATRERLRGEAERLARPGRMGSLFKVLALASLPAGAAPADFPPFAMRPRPS